ncbi:MAG: multifunctional CCA addition/repair protein [Magnetococcales bacterium]|nr:multifunctional CCA addition/repair protein [Magnetococcales bacterium]
MHVYTVGGAVRDGLLGLPVTDRDRVVLGATPELMASLGFKQVGRAFPVFLHPVTGEEYALARRERKTGPGYRGFGVDFGPDVTLREDLFRRDLTVNAMAMDASGRIIDPFSGRDDLERRILRHVSSAFAEDPLRVLRVARFQARLHHLGFSIAPETMALMGRISGGGELATLSAERVWQETENALGTPHPEMFFLVLQRCGALEPLFPELASLIDQTQPVQYHPEGDAWQHTLEVLAQASRLSADPLVRFAALTHDLGKGETPRNLLPHHHGHDQSGVLRIEKMARRLCIPVRFRFLAMQTARFHMVIHRLPELRPRTILKILESMHAFHETESLNRMLIVCQADRWRRTGKHVTRDEAMALLLACLDAARSCKAVALRDQGLSGSALGRALLQKRIQAIKNVLASVLRDRDKGRGGERHFPPTDQFLGASGTELGTGVVRCIS